ncbi:hypothetical protein M422DRAFT_249325, partial [Sphaerobolus stellatus SS14]
MPDPLLDFDQLLLKDTKRAHRRAARHSQGGPVASTAFPQQPIAGSSAVASTSTPINPINDIAFPSEHPLTPHHAQLHHTPPSTRHTPGK